MLTVSVRNDLSGYAVLSSEDYGKHRTADRFTLTQLTERRISLPDSSVGSATGHSREFCGFSQSLQASAASGSPNRSRLPPFTFFSFHHSLRLNG